MEIDLSDAKPIRARRTHQKSRLGCTNCKKRRIKVRLLALAITRRHICHILFTLSLYICHIALCFPTFSNYCISPFSSTPIHTMLGILHYLFSFSQRRYNIKRPETNSIKCDERRPACSNCSYHLVGCAYYTTAESPGSQSQVVQNLLMGGHVQADTDLIAMRQADLDKLLNYPKVSHRDLPNLLEHNVVSRRALSAQSPWPICNSSTITPSTHTGL